MTSVLDINGSVSPIQTLTGIFVAWKLLLFLVTCLSPGVGYDTSTSLLDFPHTSVISFNDTPSSLNHTVSKLIRWDAIYFTRIAERGHVFEQEWAWGMGISTVLSTVVRTFNPGASDNVQAYALAGVILSLISHWLSTIVLFSVARTLQGSMDARSSSIPLIAAVLHIVSPAGIFLVAPYTESLFSLLNMLGFYLYAKSVFNAAQPRNAASAFYKLLSGIFFGLATTIRGNGVLSGIPFLIDAIEMSLALVNPRVDLFAKSPLLLQLQCTVLAGCCVAAGMVVPQFLAYREYCIDGLGNRPWCESWFPSIYGFVQSHYWNVGFLRYWTVSNLPLFLLAVPCLYLLSVSGIEGLGISTRTSSKMSSAQKLRLRIALPQLVLAVLALTSYHVQIITRLSSGYPFWYVWLAARVDDWRYWGVTVRVLVTYALIQAGLFATFLPPA